MASKLSGRFKDVVRKVRPELLGWARGEFIQGMLVVTKVQNAELHQSEIFTAASKKVRLFGIVVSIVSFITLAILWLVVICLLWIFSGLLALFNGFNQPWALQLALKALTFSHVLSTISFIVPSCVVLFLRYWAYQDQDKVFCAALRQKAAHSTMPKKQRLEILADALEILPAKSILAWLKDYILVVLRSVCLALCLLILSAPLPRVGSFVISGAVFLKQSKRVGIIPAAVLLALSFLPESVLLPSGHMLATWGMQIFLTGRSTAEQLLHTIISRSNRCQRQILFARYHARITGFGVAAALMLSIPVVGALFWFDIVWLAADLLGNIVGEESVFDLRQEVEHFRLAQVRKKEEQEQRARDREAHFQQRQEAKERRKSE